MKKLLYILFTIGLISCSTPSDTKEFILPSDEETNEIVRAIIEHEELPVFKNEDNIPFSTKLQRVWVLSPREVKASAPPPGKFIVYIGDLLKIENSGSTFFTEQDSAFLMEQTLKLEDFTIDSAQLPGLSKTTHQQQLQKVRTGNFKAFYNMSKPLFSKDHSKAYVQLDFNCKGECGEGFTYLLEKVDGEWAVIGKLTRWIS